MVAVGGQTGVVAAEQHFACTACGQCCHGWLPLTLDDAFAQAARFPLAMVWTLVPQTNRAFDLTAQLGTTVQLGKRQQIAVLIAPTLYLPPAFPCPALSPDHLCAIQAEKPLRCRSMPFYPYRREADQADGLVPRPGWACDISDRAPVVYRHREILDRADFDAERAALLAQAPILRAYAETVLKQYPPVMKQLRTVARHPLGGHFVISLLSFLRHQRAYDPVTFAKSQHPLLIDFAARTADVPALTSYRNYYRESAAELAWFAQRA